MDDWQDPIETMEEYVSSVLAGEIVACKTVIAACKRHRKDLARQGDPDFPYFFDEEHARNVCNFFPTCVKHSIGKDAGKPFVLQPWQCFAVGSVFGWKHCETKLRRFSKAYISVGRKNGKSTIAAAICLYAAGFDYNPVTDGFESVAQVVLAASKKEQADRVTMAECLRMREQSKLLKDMSSAKNKQITFQHNSGHIITVGSDRAFDGLNGSLIQIDELHAFRSNGSQKEFLDTMRTGSGARAQPLFLVTTTAGSTSSEIWKSEWSYATGVVTGEYEDDSYFTLSYELDEEDDPLDPDNWIKANPCLGVTLTKEFLEDQAKPAAADNLALNRFTRYHGNRLVSNLDTAFNLDQWDACEGNLSDWSQADAVGCGIDLGARDDLASLSLVARFPTDEYVEDADGNENPVYRYEVRSYSYLAMDSVRDISVKPFCDFVENQLLIRSRFPLSELERDCVRYCREFGCYQVAFDPYNAQQAGERISQEGIEAVTMAQSTRHFNEPIGELRAAISDGRLRHDGNKLLRWAVSNAVIVTDRQDRMMYAKNECEEKIDPVVAMTMAFARAVAMPSRSEGYFTF
jgi:phage terminase large subunit-like protein